MPDASDESRSHRGGSSGLLDTRLARYAAIATILATVLTGLGLLVALGWPEGGSRSTTPLPPAAKALSELTPVSGTPRHVAVQVAGEAFGDSLSLEVFDGKPNVVTYVLPPGYRVLRTRVGVSDEWENRRTRVRFTVAGEGRTLGTRITSGEQAAEAFEVDISDVTRLSLIVTGTPPGAFGVFGEPILRARG